jgi:hypothetical protein
MSMFQAECPVCGKKYAGWGLVYGHNKCECGAEIEIIEKDASEDIKTYSTNLQQKVSGIECNLWSRRSVIH